VNTEQKKTGCIYFVGAGPGDPELITLKAQRLIAGSDVIIYAGSLVNRAILAHARPDVRHYDSSGMSLDQQIDVMQKTTDKGETVVRLHTGDPSIYGAIFEQMRRLEHLNIPYRVVPGVSSAFAAAAALGIEYTLPNNTQTVIFTRLEGRTPVPDSEALHALAAHRSSLVIFLSTGMIARVVDELREAGYADGTPVAIVYRASWPDELIVRGSLADIASKAEAAELTHQALIIVSPVLNDHTTAVAPDSHLYGASLKPKSRMETCAIVSLTRGGTETGKKLLELLPEAVLYAPARFIEASVGIRPYTESVRQVLHSAFQEHSTIVCIMACGIVVRELAPLLRNKHCDPGLVVLDESGHYAISLLSGHKGGANRLARQIADLLGGQAILTTSSDVQGLPALDLLGQQYGWYTEKSSQLTAVSAALVNGDTIGVFQDIGDRSWWPAVNLQDNVTQYNSIETLIEAQPSAALLITHRNAGDTITPSYPPTVIYRPSCLNVGVGCNRNTPAEEIIQAVEQTLTEAGLSIHSIATLATIEDKADEEGLLAAGERRGWPLQVFTRNQIGTVPSVPNPSEWALRALGVQGVAEPAALLAAGTNKLLVEKRKFENVTVAVALRTSDEE
jgi:precorrin-4 C11-methyltransferase